MRTDDYPWGSTASEHEAWLAYSGKHWGTEEFAAERLGRLAPSIATDRRTIEWTARVLRAAGSPAASRALTEMNAAMDVRDVLSHVNVPTLVLVRAGARMPHGATDIDAGAESRWIAERLPNAMLAELPGVDYLPWVGEPDALIDELATFVTGTRPVPELTRVLVTLLFTDIVDSTSQLSEVGDARWQDLLSRHNDAVRGVLGRYRGQEIDHAGDGFLATFDGPARAVRAAQEIVGELAALGLAVRCGVHTGEVEIGHDEISGIAVHIGARVAAHAGAGEVLVTRTVRDLTAGAGLTFRERGRRELRGVDGEFELFAVPSGPLSDADD